MNEQGMQTQEQTQSGGSAAIYLSRLRLNPQRADVQRDLANCHFLHRRLMTAFPDERSAENADADEAGQFFDLIDEELGDAESTETTRPAKPETSRARERFGLLFRVEQNRRGVVVLAQSAAQPDWSRLPEGFAEAEVKRVDGAYTRLRVGMELRFRLRANPTRRIGKGNENQGAHWRGRRVDLRREEDQYAWLRRKAANGGFRLMEVRTLVVQRTRDGAVSAPTEVSLPDVAAAPGGRVIGRRKGIKGQLTFGAVEFEGRLVVTDAANFRRSIQQGIGHGRAYGFGLLSVAPA